MSIVGMFRGCALAAGLWALLWPAGAQARTEAVAGDILGGTVVYEVGADDNLYGLARRFDLGIVELLAANAGVDPWMPEEGSALRVPLMHILPLPVREGIVIDLSDLRLYFFLDAATVMTFPIGIGREGWRTPVGQTRISRKRERPVWIPPASLRAENPDLPASVPPGPENPLGDYALDLAGGDYRIHGTNRPYGVGKRVSHGCIRLYPEDIAALFPAVRNGTPVVIVDTPYKLGWRDGTLWLQVTPTQEQADAIADYEEPAPLDIPEVYRAIEDAAGAGVAIKWYAVDAAIKARDGLPVAVAVREEGEETTGGHQ